MDRKLPDWLKESREAEKLIAWLKSPDCEVKEFSGQMFIKARYGNCFFFFDCLKENRKTDRNWCAVIHMPEYSLYEAEDLFLKPIGIPDDFGFPVREDLIPKLETQISRIGKKLIREQWDELLLKGGYAAAQMIPEISRVYIQLNADRPGDKVRSFLHVIGTNEAPDKAKGAAWTYGLKYYFLNKFNIMQASVIDDPDMRGTEKEEMPKQKASVKPEKPKKKQEKAERKETAAKPEQTEPVREKKTDRKKLRDGNAISEDPVKVEYAVTDTEENLPGQMTFGMEESESGLEKFSDEETKAEDLVQTEEISVDEEITAETDADGFRAVEETDEVPFDEDDEISFDAEEEEETPEETAEEVLEDMAHEEDAEDEVKWAEKVICNFGVYAGTPLGEMMQDARGYQTIKWLVQRYKGQNQEIQKAAKILLDHEKEMQKAA